MTCPECDGSGTYESDFSNGPRRCFKCNGTGHVDHACPYCGCGPEYCDCENDDDESEGCDE